MIKETSGKIYKFRLDHNLGFGYSIVYDFTDQLTWAIGLDIFSGPSGSFFGQFDSKDSVYLEFKYGF